MPRRVLSIAAVAACSLAAGCGSSSSSGDGGGKPAASGGWASASADAATPGSTGSPVARATITIRNFKYKPATIVVKKGGSVKWDNRDTAGHTATADDRSFDTQGIDKGKAGKVTMTEAGTFAYHCDFHPFMKATVIVK